MNIKDAIKTVVSEQHLSVDAATAVFNQIMSGEATDAQIAAFIVALRLKGETVDEITGAVSVMREKVTVINCNKKEHLVDTCGTGGDGANTFNISTTAAFVAAGAGATVAKHGNRNVSSKCGSADVLEALGVKVSVTPAIMEQCLNDVGIAFLFAPSLHAAMKYAIGPRKEIGIRTVFNILGPLTNPAGAPNQVIGVFSGAITESLAQVLNNLGSKRAFVVHGNDPLDEVSLSSDTRVSELRYGEVTTYNVKPEDFGLKRVKISEIAGDDPKENAFITRAVLEGKKGVHRDIVVLNAAFAITAAGLAETPLDAILLAKESIDSGAALDKLNKLILISNG